MIRSIDPAGDAADTVEDPFRTGAMRVTPTSSARLEGGQYADLPRTFTIYPGPAAGAPALTFEFILDGKVIGRSAASSPSRTKRAELIASFPTEIFAPGEYGLRAVATQGAASATSQTRFVLIP